MNAARFCFPVVSCIVQWMHETPVSCGDKKKNNDDQEVFHLNAWEFAMLWEVKLLPANAQATRRALQERAKAANDL